jgi:hypothetical protein
MIRKNLLNVWDVLWVKCQGYVVFLLISLPFGIATFLMGLAAFIVMFPVFCIYELIANRSKEGSAMDKFREAKRKAQQHVVNHTGAIGNTFQDIVDEAEDKMENAKNRARSIVRIKSRDSTIKPDAKEQKDADTPRGGRGAARAQGGVQMARLTRSTTFDRDEERKMARHPSILRDPSSKKSKSKKAYVVNGPVSVTRRAHGSFVSIDDSAFNIPFLKVFQLADTDEMKKQIAALESKMMDRMALLLEAYGMQRVTPLPSTEAGDRVKHKLDFRTSLPVQEEEEDEEEEDEKEGGLNIHTDDTAAVDSIDVDVL